jgi:hypothetical protein
MYSLCVDIVPALRSDHNEWPNDFEKVPIIMERREYWKEIQCMVTVLHSTVLETSGHG